MALSPPAVATEDEIRAHRATEPTLFALAANPRVFVADFPDLDLQASALNRVAALDREGRRAARPGAD